MKKISILLLLLFAFGVSFSSCTKDFEDGLNYSGFNNNENPGNGDNTENETTNDEGGDYWPTAIGNQWIIDENGSEVSMKMIAKEGDYYKFDQFSGIGDGVSGTASVYLKKVKGDYLLKVDALTLDYGEGMSAKMSGYEFILFKDYLDVNRTWTGNFVQTTSFSMEGLPSVTMNISYTGTILEKISSVNIENNTYKDVIKFKFHQEAKILGQSATSNDTEYWIAKNIGIIKYTRLGIVSSLVTYDIKNKN